MSDVSRILLAIDELDAKLDLIIAKLRRLSAMETNMSMELTQLTAQVAANTDLEKSAIQLINGLAAKLAEAGTDPAKLQALHDALATSASDLAAAIAANTPAAPVPPA